MLGRRGRRVAAGLGPFSLASIPTAAFGVSAVTAARRCGHTGAPAGDPERQAIRPCAQGRRCPATELYSHLDLAFGPGYISIQTEQGGSGA